MKTVTNKNVEILNLLALYHQDVAYVHSQQNTPTTPTTSESECTPNITHATRVSPATVSVSAEYVVLATQRLCAHNAFSNLREIERKKNEIPSGATNKKKILSCMSKYDSHPNNRLRRFPFILHLCCRFRGSSKTMRPPKASVCPGPPYTITICAIATSTNWTR